MLLNPTPGYAKNTRVQRSPVILVVLYKNRLFSTHERKTIKEEIAHHGLGSKMCKIFRKEKSVVFAKLTTRLVTSKSISIAKKHHSNFRLVFSLLPRKKTETKTTIAMHAKSVKICRSPHLPFIDGFG